MNAASSPAGQTPLNLVLPTPETTIVVGMSGGVDSAVAAARLKAQGYNVLALFMKNWQDVDGSACSAEEDFAQVEKVCAQLKLTYYAVEFQQEYWDHVFTHFLREYEQGYTPNPDILCNREIKFKYFWQKALALGGMVATGHYAQTKSINGETALLKGAYPGKDQSYFLYTLKSNILQKVCFPVGDLLKSEVRRYAQDLNLSNATRKDS
ncbi:MAG: tRNA 2-thiouridine(34) synthase MnmA, partial [Bacteriovoracaceae bacterium]|nr:tRNA 2-thiouridine(34) synthase MnmA [Bacteriovoracaceae bacterium]